MKKTYSEKEAMQKTGKSRQTLMEYRLGKTQPDGNGGFYLYKTRLKEGTHWLRIGTRGVAWLQPGIDAIKSGNQIFYTE